jgi:hypothetical protein
MPRFDQGDARVSQGVALHPLEGLCFATLRHLRHPPIGAAGGGDAEPRLRTVELKQ